MKTSLAALLNRRPCFERLQRHWSRDAVLELTEELAEADPLGLCAHGAPRDEYQPEALLAIVKLLGLSHVDELWPFRPTDAALRLPAACGIEAALRAAFSELFFEGAGHSLLGGVGAAAVADLSRQLNAPPSPSLPSLLSLVAGA